VTDGFTWGWDAFVAAGTLALAFATLALALATRRMAGAAAADIRSQWRPAIAPGTDVEVEFLDRQGVRGDGVVILNVQNVGRGAAFELDAGLDLGDAVVPASPWALDEPAPRNLSILPPGEDFDFYFDFLDQRPGTSTLIIDYQDLNGRPYSSKIVIEDVRSWTEPEVGILRMAKVELLDNHELIPWKAPRGRLRFLVFRLREWWKWKRLKTRDFIEF